jgi:gliding motility-associated-like protein
VGQSIGFVGPAQSVDWEYSYAWVNLDFSNDVISTANNIEVTNPGSYELTTTMTAPCFYTTSGIVVAEFEVCELGFIPNIISPNGDDVNNSFAIEGLEFFNNSTLKVYNRWGTLVFESDNYKGNWSPREEEATDGTYFYVLGVNFPTGMEYFNGPLTIVR